MAQSLDPRYKETADALGMSVEDLLTAISYETAGTFSPVQKGPTTKWGQHKGLIQFGEPQAEKYGVDFSSPEAALSSQLGEEGAIVQYMLDHGFKPGEHDFMDFYSTINAGAPGRYGASDAAAGGAPGTVADKVTGQMQGHRAKARKMAGLPVGEMDLGIGPTQARADAGLPLDTREPPEEDRSGFLGGLLDKRDTMRANVRDKLGINEKQANAIGGGLQGLGQYLMAGGFR